MPAPTPTISTNRRVAGTSFLTIDAQTIELGDDFSWRTSTPERDDKGGLSGIYGYKEKPRAGYIKGTAFLTPDGLSMTQIGNLNFTTLVASLADGSVITVKDGWQVGELELNAAEGSFSFEFHSGTVIEQPAAA